jgi:predicted ArsR family transcriptional regulator
MDGPSVPGGVTRLKDAKALRAYAHPVRMKLIMALRSRGPLTATQAGRLLGESSGTCSFHLRQLAKYGLVEEAGGGTGRQKPWQATTMWTEWENTPGDPEFAAAAGLLSEVTAETYFGQAMRWLEARPGEPAQWQRAAFFGDAWAWMTADELADLERETLAVTSKYFERHARPELRPPGARLVAYLHLGFPDQTLPDNP